MGAYGANAGDHWAAKIEVAYTRTVWLDVLCKIAVDDDEIVLAAARTRPSRLCLLQRCNYLPFLVFGH